MSKETQETIDHLCNIIFNNSMPSTQEILEIKEGLKSVLDAINYYEEVTKEDQNCSERLQDARTIISRAGITSALKELVSKKFISNLT
jgi:hypothetical protein